MNFYSLDGSKMDFNNISKNKQIYESFDNTYNLSSSIPSTSSKSTSSIPTSSIPTSSLDNIIDDNEEFSNIPTTKSNATDNNYQCSDGYNVKGTTLNKDLTGVSLVDCKNMCIGSGNDCIGFNYDNSNKKCTMKKDTSSLINSQSSSTLCIKKSAGNTSCKVNNNYTNDNTIKAFNDLDSIFNNNTQLSPQNLNTVATSIVPSDITSTSIEPTNVVPTNVVPTNVVIPTQKYPMEIPSINTNQPINTDILAKTKFANSNDENKVNIENNSQGVYVDLDCFMKNINILQNRTDNMMIDLSLLLSNIKTCSYIKKNTSNTKVSLEKMDMPELINQITSKINIPEPDTVKLKNINVDLLVRNDGSNSSTQLLEVVKEPFTSDYNSTSNWIYKDFVLVIILVILLCLLIFRN